MKNCTVGSGRPRVTRRSFVAGAVAAGAGSLVASALPALADEEAAIAAEEGDVEATYEVYECDVLVVGAGTAGVAAVNGAVAEGARVLVVEKGPFGVGGAAGMNFDYLCEWHYGPVAYNRAANVHPCSNSQAWANACALQEEKNEINPARDGRGQFLDLEWANAGQTFPGRNEDGSVRDYINQEAIEFKMVDHSFPRHDMDHVYNMKNVAVVDNTMLTDFIVSEGECLGAMGIHIPTGAFRVFRANATVLACGGCCWFAGWNTVAPQSAGVPDNTSDLEMAALRRGLGITGAECADYDLMSVYPTGISCGYAAGLGCDNYNDPSMMLDKNGVAFLNELADRDTIITDRSLFCRTIGQVVADGNGSPNGGIYVDYTTEESRAGLRYFYKRNIEMWKERFDLDPTQEWVECGHEMIEHSGSIVVDENLECPEMPGLFGPRAGNVISISGNPGLEGNAMLGRLAGHNAALHALEDRERPALDWAAVDEEFSRLSAIRTASPVDGLRPVEVRRAIQRISGPATGVIRETAALEAARDELARIRREDIPRQIVADQSSVYNMEWKEAIENINLCAIAELTVNATLERTESRAAYKRPEYPERSEEWNCALVGYANEAGDLSFVKVEQPTGDFSQFEA